MNVRQAIAVAVGTVAALILVLIPRAYTHPRLVSRNTQPNGTIVRTYKSAPSLWQPLTFALVVLVTGASVYSLRRKGQDHG